MERLAASGMLGGFLPGICMLSLALIFVTAIWGWTFVVVKGAADEYGVLAFLAVRFSIATLVISPLAIRTWSTTAVKTGAWIGVVLAGGYLFQTFGLVHTTATNTGLITGLFVVFAPVFNRLLFGVSAPRVFWLAAALSLVGMYLLTSGDPAADSEAANQATLFGDLLTLGAAACLGLHIALLDRYAKGHEASALAAGQMGAMAVVLVVLALSPVSGPSISWPSPQVWQALLITGILASAGGFYVQTVAQRKLPAVRIAVILTLEPLFAALFGWLAGDRLNGLQVFGGILMISALGLAEIYPQWRRRAMARRAAATANK